MKFRPVTFRYKEDPKGERQYGLIAEEVARVYPELVSHDTDGKVITVRYHELVPMLLNETQKQADQIEKQAQEIERLNAKVAEGKAERASFEQRLSALEQRGRRATQTKPWQRLLSGKSASWIFRPPVLRDWRLSLVKQAAPAWAGWPDAMLLDHPRAPSAVRSVICSSL